MTIFKYEAEEVTTGLQSLVDFLPLTLIQSSLFSFKVQSIFGCYTWINPVFKVNKSAGTRSENKIHEHIREYCEQALLTLSPFGLKGWILIESNFNKKCNNLC